MLEEMTPEVLLKWNHFQALEPLPLQQIRDMLAILCSVVAGVSADGDGKIAVFRGPKGKLMEASEFVPKYWYTPRTPVRVAPTKGTVVKGMSESDSAAFMAELVGG